MDNLHFFGKLIIFFASLPDYSFTLYHQYILVITLNSQLLSKLAQTMLNTSLLREWKNFRLDCYSFRVLFHSCDFRPGIRKIRKESYKIFELFISLMTTLVVLYLLVRLQLSDIVLQVIDMI